jgi:hypothetical protein
LRECDAAHAAARLKEKVPTGDKAAATLSCAVTAWFVRHGFALLIDVEELVGIEDDMGELSQCRLSAGFRLLLQKIRCLA